MPEGPLIENPKLRRAMQALDRRAASLVRRARARRGPKTSCEPFILHSTVGYRLQAWLHRPLDLQGPLPAVVLCPPDQRDASVFADRLGLVTADEVARLGCIALRFDPAGRGGSWGEEDYGGPEHQDEVACLVRHLCSRPDVDGHRIGILSLGSGLSMAIGAAAIEKAPVAWILDWEGPSDRETRNGGEPLPAPARPFDDDVYWKPREPARHVGALPCPYVRLQAEEDSFQPGELRHSSRMLHAAARGGLPWFQLNDHPRGEVPPRPYWVPPGQLNANRAILRKLGTLLLETRLER